MTVISDDFGRGDGALGASWENVQYGLVIDGYRARGSTVAGQHIQVSRVTGSVGDAQFAEVTTTVKAASSGYNGNASAMVQCTISGPGDTYPGAANGYTIIVSGDGNAYLRRKEGHPEFSGTILDNQLYGGPIENGDPVTYRIEHDGVDSITGYINGVETLHATDTTFLGGKPALIVQTDNDFPGAYVYFDNFTGGDLGGGFQAAWARGSNIVTCNGGLC